MITKEFIVGDNIQHKNQIISRFNHQMESKTVRDHSIEVANLSVELGQLFGLEPSICYTAGLLHDIAKPDCKTFKSALEFINANGVKARLSKKDDESLHEVVGAAYVNQLMNVCDTRILQAIKAHTSFRGIKKGSMYDYSKVLIIADKLCPGRGTAKKAKVLNTSGVLVNVSEACCVNDAFVITLKELIDYRLCKNLKIEKSWIETYNHCVKKTKEVKL